MQCNALTTIHCTLFVITGHKQCLMTCCLILLVSHHFTRVPVRVTQGDITVQVDFVIVTDELKNCDMKSAGERHSVFCHANGVVLCVGTPENADK